MKKKRLDRDLKWGFAGIVCLVISFVWMLVTQASAGPFLILASVGGALLVSAKSNWRKK